MADDQWKKVKAFVEKVGERTLQSGQTAYDAHVIFEDGSEVDVSFFAQPTVKESAGKELEFLMQTKGKYTNGKLIEEKKSGFSGKGSGGRAATSDKELMLRARTMTMAYAKDLVQEVIKAGHYPAGAAPELTMTWMQQWTLDTYKTLMAEVMKDITFKQEE